MRDSETPIVALAPTVSASHQRWDRSGEVAGHAGLPKPIGVAARRQATSVRFCVCGHSPRGDDQHDEPEIGGERMSVPLSTDAIAPDLGSWRGHAACQHGDHELFFPPEEEQGEYFRLRVSMAKRICANCPVRRQCTSYALAHDERYGVWGGLTPAERERLRRRAVA